MEYDVVTKRAGKRRYKWLAQDGFGKCVAISPGSKMTAEAAEAEGRKIIANANDVADARKALENALAINKRLRDERTEQKQMVEKKNHRIGELDKKVAETRLQLGKLKGIESTRDMYHDLATKRKAQLETWIPVAFIVGVALGFGVVGYIAGIF